MPRPTSSHRVWIAVAVLAALTLSGHYSWQNRDIPQFGFLHDDGIYLTSAKSLADGQGYRIEHLPHMPAQTKYPPLYPVLLAGIWKVTGSFPDCLLWAGLLGWLAVPILAGLSGVLYRQYGFPAWKIGALALLLALNPYITLFSANLLSESLFLCFLLASFVWVARGRSGLGGLAGAAAYLTRSAGVVLLVSQPLAWWLAGHRRRSIRYVLILGPVIAGWMLWTRLNATPSGPDWILAYYTDYFSYQKENTPLEIFHLVLWKNLDGLLYSLGSLVIPKVLDMLPAKILAQVLGLAMLTGTFRLARRVAAARDFAWFAAGSLVMLVVWHFPPTERFVLPLAPLLFAGLIEEIEHFTGLLRASFRHPDVSQRVAAGLFAGVAGLLAIFCLGLQVWVLNVYMPATAQNWRERRQSHQPAYQWIKGHTSPETVFIAYDDSLLYLETGRQALSVPLPTRFWYTGEFSKQVDVYRRIATLARNHGAQFVFFTSEDLDRDAAPDQRDAIALSLKNNPELKPVWNDAHGTIFEVTAR